MSSTRTLWQLFKEQLKTQLFFTAFSPQSASAFLITALLKFYHCIVLYCIAKLCSVVSELLTYRAWCTKTGRDVNKTPGGSQIRAAGRHSGARSVLSERRRGIIVGVPLRQTETLSPQRAGWSGHPRSRPHTQTLSLQVAGDDLSFVTAVHSDIAFYRFSGANPSPSGILPGAFFYSCIYCRTTTILS